MRFFWIRFREDLRSLSSRTKFFSDFYSWKLKVSMLSIIRINSSELVESWIQIVYCTTSSFFENAPKSTASASKIVTCWFTETINLKYHKQQWQKISKNFVFRMLSLGGISFRKLNQGKSKSNPLKVLLLRQIFTISKNFCWFGKIKDLRKNHVE